MSTHSGYETQQAAGALPLLEDEAFDVLVADIRANGLIGPIPHIDGRMILDCRNSSGVHCRGGPRPKDPFRHPASSRGHPKKEGHLVAIPQAVPEPPLRASSDSSERD